MRLHVLEELTQTTDVEVETGRRHLWSNLTIAAQVWCAELVEPSFHVVGIKVDGQDVANGRDEACGDPTVLSDRGGRVAGTSRRQIALPRLGEASRDAAKKLLLMYRVVPWRERSV